MLSIVEEIKRKVQNVAYGVSEIAQSAATIAGEKATELKDRTETRAAIAAEKRNLAKSYRELGEWYAANCGEDVPKDGALILGAVRASQGRIEALIARLKQEEALEGIDGEEDADAPEDTEPAAEAAETEEKAEELHEAAEKALDE